MEQKSTRRRPSRKTLLIVLVVVLAILVVAVVGMIVLGMQQKRDAELNEQMKQIAQQTPVPTSTPSASASATATVDIPIDFASLQTQNQDIYAWITIPGTDVDYPVVQNPIDDTFYLTHNVAGQESIEGAIYTERLNQKDFSDPNTVIYGHRMNNGSMFASLHDYQDKDFFDNNREIVIYTPAKKLTYQIFAAYETDDAHILGAYDFSNPEAYTGYLNSISEVRDMKANIDRTMQIDNEDQIITLSTCVKGQDHKRYLVQAVLEKNE